MLQMLTWQFGPRRKLLTMGRARYGRPNVMGTPLSRPPLVYPPDPPHALGHWATGPETPHALGH